MIKVRKNFVVGVQYMKSNFYCCFNSVFHREKVLGCEILGRMPPKISTDFATLTHT